MDSPNGTGMECFHYNKKNTGKLVILGAHNGYGFIKFISYLCKQVVC